MLHKGILTCEYRSQQGTENWRVRLALTKVGVSHPPRNRIVCSRTALLLLPPRPVISVLILPLFFTASLHFLSFLS